MKIIRNYIMPVALVVITGMVILTSCVKDSFNFDKLSHNYKWNPTIAVPIVNADLDLRDLLRDYDTTELFIEDATGFLYVEYKRRVISIRACDFIKIPNQDFPQVFSTSDMSIAGNKYYGLKDSARTFNVADNMRLDSIILNKATLRVRLTSTFLHTGTLKITYPTVRVNGVIYTVSIPINTATGTFDAISTHPLDGGHVDLSNSGLADNKLPMKFELFLDNSSVPINPGEAVCVFTAWEAIDFKTVYGYLGHRALQNITDTMNLHLAMFDHALNGDPYFANPQVNAYIYNGWGIPVSFRFVNLSAYSAITNLYYPITVSQTPVVIAAPAISQMGQTLLTTVSYNSSNCNMADVMKNFPKYLYYTVDATCNPDISVNNNFVLDTSRFSLDVEAILPLYGHVNFFALQDTADMNFDEYYEDLSVLKSLTIRLNVLNGFPTEVGVQAYFTDSNYVRKDSLFNDVTEVISSGQINADGKVICSTLKTTDITFTKERIDNLKGVRYVIFKGFARTTNGAQTLVKIYSTYGMQIKLGMQAEFEITKNDVDRWQSEQ